MAHSTNPSLPVSMKLIKYCALGNDYWVASAKSFPNLSAEQVRRICNRHWGLGGDGVLQGPTYEGKKTYGLKIYNADGSHAEMSGNGLTIFARYLIDEGHVANEGHSFYLKPSERLVRCEITNSENIRLSLGRANLLFQGSVKLSDALCLRFHLPPSLTFYAVNLGNPHCVVPVKKTSKALACSLGPLFENDSNFPSKTNVQFVEAVAGNRCKIEIWERGSGYTLASGSSACAVARVLAHLNSNDSGLFHGEMPGGTLGVEVEHENCAFTHKAIRIAEATPFF